jgi:hypothetical protein
VEFKGLVRLQLRVALPGTNLMALSYAE